jgi:hypothetical protein
LIASSALLVDDEDEDEDAAAGVKNTPPSLRKDQTASIMSECSNDSSLTLNSMRQALESNPNTVTEGVEGDVMVRDDDSDAMDDEEEDDGGGDDDDSDDDDSDDDDGNDDSSGGDDDDDDNDDEDDNDDDDNNNDDEEEGRRRRQQQLKGIARDAHAVESQSQSIYPQISSSSSSLFLSGGRNLHNRRLSSTVCNVETEVEMEEIYT